ncbi:hypothetical protein [Jeotgalibaca porci]
MLHDYIHLTELAFFFKYWKIMLPLIISFLVVLFVAHYILEKKK